MPDDVFSVDPGPFADVPERITTDYLLYGLQQQMTQLTGQADVKGSIIITASAIVISVSVTQFNVDELRWSLVTLVAFVLLALLSSGDGGVPEVQDPPRARRPAAARVQPVLLRSLLADHRRRATSS